MRLTFPSVNVVASCRRVISSRRGCSHVPGLSVTGGVAGVGFLGVTIVFAIDRDMIVMTGLVSRSREYRRIN